MHRRHGMAAHHGMPVDAERLAPVGGEERPEGRVAFQLRRPDHDGHGRLAEDRRTDVDRAADAADRRRGIEGRTDLVVAQGRPEPVQPLQRRGKIGVHPGRALAAAGARDADRRDRTQARPLLGRRDVEEQGRRHAGRGQSLHDVGRAGQVVAVEGEEQVRHRRTAPRTWRGSARAPDDPRRSARGARRRRPPPRPGGRPSRRRPVRPDG